MLVGRTVERFKVNGEEIILRYPEMNDAEDLRKHINSLIEEGAEIQFAEKISLEEEIDWLADGLEEIENGKSIFIVPEIDGEVVGLSNVKMKDKQRVSHTGTFGIGLRKEFRGLGIGKRLAETVIAEAKERLNVEILELSMHKTNNVARNLYEELGFEKAGEVEKGVKQDGEYVNKVIMQKVLI